MKDMSGFLLSNEKYFWLCLKMIKGVGNNVFLSLINRFGSPKKVFNANIDELLDTGIRKELAYRIIKKEFLLDPDKEVRKLQVFGARLITFNDEEYPPLLKEIDYPPMILYAKGKPLPKDQFFISIVGSRNASSYGLRVAEDFSYKLAKIGIGIVSGMARGIDSFAHKGALKAKGYTIAVLGTGIDIIYPKDNKNIFESIEKNGTIITEFPLGMHPEAKNFPIRNRIISGISKGVLVIEATKKSGSLITASFALNQGREVFAIPGSIESIKSRGTHFLIKQGAKLVEDVQDILEEFGIRDVVEDHHHDNNKTASFDLNSKEQLIYKYISEYPVHIDEIIRNTGMDAPEVLSSLLKMELKGAVVQLPGRMYIRKIRG